MKDIYKRLPLFQISEELKKSYLKENLHCLIMGNFGAMNSGDEAILAGQLQELKKAHIKSTVIARFPQKVRSLHKVPAVSFYDLLGIIREIKQADFIIVGGGGIISKIDRSWKDFLFQLYMLTVFFIIPKVFKKDVYALGIGIYANTNKGILAISYRLLKSVKLVTVRDFHSYYLLVGKGVPVYINKDTSFHMDILPPEKILKQKFFKRYYNTNKLHVAISLLKPGDKIEEENILRELTKFVALHKKEADFWFYSLDSHTSFYNDFTFGKKLAGSVRQYAGKNANFFFVPLNWHPKNTFSSFQLMDLVISMRLHGSIFAYRLGKELAGISYDKKCSSFLLSIGKEPVYTKDVKVGYLQGVFHSSRKRKREQEKQDGEDSFRYQNLTSQFERSVKSRHDVP